MHLHNNKGYKQTDTQMQGTIYLQPSYISNIYHNVQACMAGIVFAKFTKPANRAETGFSVILEDDATVICEEPCAWVVLHLKITY